MPEDKTIESVDEERGETEPKVEPPSEQQVEECIKHTNLLST